MSYPTTETDPQDRLRHYLSRFKWERVANYLRISLGLLSGALVNTRLDDLGSIPALTQHSTATYSWKQRAWGGGYEVTFNWKTLGDNLAYWIGAAWHELGHILWSDFVSKSPVTKELNILEDARIEALLLRKYPKTRGPLLAILHYLISMAFPPDRTVPSGWSERAAMYAWVAGRAHLPLDIRRKFRNLVENHPAPPAHLGEGVSGADAADMIDDIFRRYLGMGDKLNARKANQLAMELEEIIHGSVTGSIEGLTHSCVRSIGDNSSVVPSVRSDHDMPSDPIPMPDNKGMNTDMDTDNEGTSSEDKPSSNDTDTGVVGGKSASDMLYDNVEFNKALGELADTLSEYEKDSDLQAEISTLQRSVSSQTSELQVGGTTRNPADTAKYIARHVRMAAARFNDDSSRGLVRKQDMGRLKPARLDMYDDITTAYDQWKPGLDQEMYVALCIDTSGSMSGKRTMDWVYALEMGLSDVATVETVTFDSDFRTVPMGSNTHTSQVVITESGGTEPTRALLYLYSRILMRPETNKLLVIYTDGAWDNTQRGDYGDVYLAAKTVLDSLKRQGVNVRILVEERTKYDGMYSWRDQLCQNLGFDSSSTEVRSLRGLQNLPSVVIEWTRTILTRPTLG